MGSGLGLEKRVETVRLGNIPSERNFLAARLYDLSQIPLVYVGSLGQILDKPNSQPVKHMRINGLFAGAGNVDREYIEQIVQQQLASQLPPNSYNVIVVANSSVLGSIPAEAIRGYLKMSGVDVEGVIPQLDGYGRRSPTQAHALLLPGLGTVFAYQRPQLDRLTRPR